MTLTGTFASIVVGPLIALAVGLTGWRAARAWRPRQAANDNTPRPHPCSRRPAPSASPRAALPLVRSPIRR